MDFGNSAGYYRGSHQQGSISSPSSRFSPSPSPSSFLPASPFLSSAFPRYLGASYPRANQVTGFGGATIGIGPGKYSAAYRKSEIDPKQRQKKFGSDLTDGKKKIASKLSKSDPEIKILGPKPAASKTPSLYEALRNRANMEARAVPKTAALFKSGEVSGNSLDEFPVSFHPEEELARKG